MAPALGSPLVYAAVSIGDKVILSRAAIPLASFYFHVGFSQLAIAAIVLAVNPIHSLPWDVGLMAYGAGFIWRLALTLMFWVLKREEVSRVTPVWQSSPIFTAILAVLFLGETLTWNLWLAILLVVAGAAAVSVDLTRRGSGSVLRPTFLMLIAGAMLIGTAQMLLKQVSDDLSVWHSMAIRGLGLFTSLGLPYARPSNLIALARYLAVPRQGLMLIGAETIGPLFGNLMLLTAIANGPVSLVSALIGTRPVFVLAGTVLLGLTAKGLLSDRMGKSDVLVKGLSTCAVIGGIALIAYG